MGPYIEMLAPFVAWFVGLSVLTDIAAFIVGRYVCANLPEDEEAWDPVDPFIMPQDK